MKATALEDLFTWSVYQPDRRIDFNGFYWRRPAGGVLIDPMPLTEDAESWLAEQAGGVRWIVFGKIETEFFGPVQSARILRLLKSGASDDTGTVYLKAAFPPDDPETFVFELLDRSTAD